MAKSIFTKSMSQTKFDDAISMQNWKNVVIELTEAIKNTEYEELRSCFKLDQNPTDEEIALKLNKAVFERDRGNFYLDVFSLEFSRTCALYNPKTKTFTQP